MKTFLTAAGWGVGFIYGLLAVVLVYSDVPLPVQGLIVVGVTAAGACAGYLIGVVLNSNSPEER